MVALNPPPDMRVDMPGRLHFFWALNDFPSSVPDGWTYRQLWNEDGTIALSSATENNWDAIHGPDFCAQVRYVRQLTALRPPENTAIDVMFRELPRVGELSGQVSESFDGPTTEDHEVTVAHLTLSTVQDPTWDQVSSAFSWGLEMVHVTHLALHEVLGGSIIFPPTGAAATNPVIGLEVCIDGEWRATRPAALLILNVDRLAAQADFTAEQLTKLGISTHRAALHLPMGNVTDLRRSALVAAHGTGDERAAIVLAATACETLLDVLMSALLWEEGKTPEEGAEELDRLRDTAQRLQRLLPSRLGGSWDVTRVPALRDWRRSVAAPRNRVVHTGGQPSTALARQACDAMAAFTSFVLDRVCSDHARTRFPMTALIVATRVGLESRGGWTKKIRAAALEAEKIDLDGVFARWYVATTELRQPPDMRQQPGSGTPGTVKLVITTSGQTY